MNWVKWRLLSLCITQLGLGTHVVFGQQVLMLDDAVREALESHPALQVESGRIATADALTQQAGLRPNPRLFVQSENWSLSGAPAQAIASTFTDQFFYASQVLETAGKRQRRVEVAQRNAQLTQLDRELLGRQIESRVKFAYWSAAGAQRALEVLQESQRNLQQTVEYHEIQLREGSIAEADVLRVRLEGDRGSVAVENATREAEASRIALLREIGRDTFADIRLGESLESAPDPPPVDIERALAARTDVRRAQGVIEQTRASLRLQQSIARPDVEVLSGYKRTSGYNTLLWGFQVNLPFFNKNQGNIAAATSEINVAEAQLKSIKTRVRADIESAVRDVNSRKQRLAGSVAVSLARAADSVTVARAAYREGGTDLLRLLDAERMHLEIQLLNARTQMEYRQSLVVLETTLGVSR